RHPRRGRARPCRARLGLPSNEGLASRRCSCLRSNPCDHVVSLRRGPIPAHLQGEDLLADVRPDLALLIGQRVGVGEQLVVQLREAFRHPRNEPIQVLDDPRVGPLPPLVPRPRLEPAAVLGPLRVHRALHRKRLQVGALERDTWFDSAVVELDDHATPSERPGDHARLLCEPGEVRAVGYPLGDALRGCLAHRLAGAERLRGLLAFRRFRKGRLQFTHGPPSASEPPPALAALSQPPPAAPSPPLAPAPRDGRWPPAPGTAPGSPAPRWRSPTRARRVATRRQRPVLGRARGRLSRPTRAALGGRRTPPAHGGRRGRYRSPSVSNAGCWGTGWQRGGPARRRRLRGLERWSPHRGRERRWSR